VEEKENSKDSGKDTKEKSTPKYNLNSEGLSVFKEDKLVGFMNGQEARAYNLITNKFKGAFISIAYGEQKVTNNISFEVMSSKSQIKTSMEQDKVGIDIKLKMSLNLVQYGQKGNIGDNKELKKLEQKLNEKLEAEIVSAIKKAQTEFKSDIFGFGLNFHVDNPKQWKTIKTKWNDYFASANVKVAVDSSVYVVGEIKKPFIMEED
jgi:spore germination protein KC